MHHRQEWNSSIGVAASIYYPHHTRYRIKIIYQSENLCKLEKDLAAVLFRINTFKQKITAELNLKKKKKKNIENKMNHPFV